MLAFLARVPPRPQKSAPLAELVDARDLKSLVRMDVPVRVRQGAPKLMDSYLMIKFQHLA